MTDAVLPLDVWNSQTFPYAFIEVQPERERTSFDAIATAGFQIARLRVPNTAVELDGRRAAERGFKDHAKVLWQMSGCARVIDVDATHVVRDGEAVLLPLSRTYRFESDADCDTLILVFDAAERPFWRDLAQAPARIIARDSAALAARAAVASLVDSADGRQDDTPVVEAGLDLMTHALCAADPLGSPNGVDHRLRKATLLINEHIGDSDYGPLALARDLGRSRRSLYNDFAELGITPAAFIRDMRLRRARQAILADASQPLSCIALHHGFPDIASFSHAFRKAFGSTPSTLAKSGRRKRAI